MLEPSDSQEAFDMTAEAIAISKRWRIPVMLRLTTRICHSKTVVNAGMFDPPASSAHFERDVKGLVMIPAYARIAHKKLRVKLNEIADWNEDGSLNQRIDGDTSLGIIAAGISYYHVREAAPDASFLKLGMTYPLPLNAIRSFAESVDRLVAIEEGDPYLVDSIRAAGISIEGKPEMYRFGEFDVDRVRRILAGDETPETAPPAGKPPQLCTGCPHRLVFQILSDLDCVVAGDIGCYTLGVLPPFNAMDTCVCMGASVGVGLGLRHVLPNEEARRVVSVIGDSTFIHSGITGLVEMVYNRPKTGHLVIILDNGTTAMTGLQEHPGTGRSLDHSPAHQISYEKLGQALGIEHVYTFDPMKETKQMRERIIELLDTQCLALLIVRKPCVLSARKIKQYELAAAKQKECAVEEV